MGYYSGNSGNLRKDKEGNLFNSTKSFRIYKASNEIYSYREKIAFFDASIGHWIFNFRNFSVTTSKHQNSARSYLEYKPNIIKVDVQSLNGVTRLKDLKEIRSYNDFASQFLTKKQKDFAKKYRQKKVEERIRKNRENRINRILTGKIDTSRENYKKHFLSTKILSSPYLVEKYLFYKNRELLEHLIQCGDFLKRMETLLAFSTEARSILESIKNKNSLLSE